MEIITFPLDRVVEINQNILKTEPGFNGHIDIGKLSGALARIDNAVAYQGLDDVFEIAAKYALSIAVSHAFSDANKRTGFCVAHEYLSLNGYGIINDNDYEADAMVDLVLTELTTNEFADILYSSYLQPSIKK